MSYVMLDGMYNVLYKYYACFSLKCWITWNTRNDWVRDITGAGASLLSLDTLPVASGERCYIANCRVGYLWLFIPANGFSSTSIIFCMDPSVDFY